MEGRKFQGLKLQHGRKDLAGQSVQLENSTHPNVGSDRSAARKVPAPRIEFPPVDPDLPL